MTDHRRSPDVFRKWPPPDAYMDEAGNWWIGEGKRLYIRCEQGAMFELEGEMKFGNVATAHIVSEQQAATFDIEGMIFGGSAGPRDAFLTFSVPAGK